jgi:4-hydroxybenzoate polyprenyltransferase
MVTDHAPGASEDRRRSPGLGSVAGRLRHEVRLTWRMIADNLMVALFPTVLGAVAAGVRYQRPAEARLVGVGEAVVLALLAVYVNDASNQVDSGAEDAVNKPYRPIPAGLATPVGLARRYWAVMVIYALIGWVLGVWPWVLLWEATVFLAYRWGSPRHYLYWKPAFNFSGASLPIVSGWQVLAPLDSTAWRWIGFVAVYFTLALIYEDVRDMEGDRTVGRRTLTLVVGSAFVRCWFTALMVLLPFVFYVVLARPSGAADWKGLTSAAVIGVLAWTCAARALLRRERGADRVTYQLFYVVWALTLATAPLLIPRT